MTLEEIKKLSVLEPFSIESDREEQWYLVGLKQGIEIAEEHFKSIL